MTAISIQLYTLRDHTARDFAGTVRTLADIGYRAVELAGYGNLKTAHQARRALDDAGLKVSGAHVNMDLLLADPAAFTAEQAVLGNSLIICPWVALDGKGEPEYRTFGEKLNSAGQLARKHGLTFAYHNHSFEFKPLRPGLDGMDVLFTVATPDNVKAELDLFWVQHGGHDPVKYLQKLGRRTVAVHLKDMEVGPDRRFANLGHGILDFKAILPVCHQLGLTNLVVEQDNCYGQDPLDAAKISFEYLKHLGFA